MLANNQRFEFSMSISNQALTAQVPVNAARASMRLQPGCYTIIETPVVGMLPGDREAFPHSVKTAIRNHQASPHKQHGVTAYNPCL